MRSVKPGRGSSAAGAVGSVVMVLFGILWTVLAYSMTKDAPFPLVGVIFPLFGVIFVIMGIVQTIIHFKNATGRNRMSLYDVVDSESEPDPFNPRVRGVRKGHTESHAPDHKQQGDGFCPYCGAPRQADYTFCPSCGKSLSSIRD